MKALNCRCTVIIYVVTVGEAVIKVPIVSKQALLNNSTTYKYRIYSYCYYVITLIGKLRCNYGC